MALPTKIGENKITRHSGTRAAGGRLGAHCGLHLQRCRGVFILLLTFNKNMISLMILPLCPKPSISVVPLNEDFHRTTPSVKLMKPNYQPSETYLIPPTIYGRRQLIMVVRICSTSILNDAGRGGLRMGGGSGW